MLSLATAFFRFIWIYPKDYLTNQWHIVANIAIETLCIFTRHVGLGVYVTAAVETAAEAEHQHSFSSTRRFHYCFVLSDRRRSHTIDKRTLYTCRVTSLNQSRSLSPICPVNLYLFCSVYNNIIRFYCFRSVIQLSCIPLLTAINLYMDIVRKCWLL